MNTRNSDGTVDSASVLNQILLVNKEYGLKFKSKMGILQCSSSNDAVALMVRVASLATGNLLLRSSNSSTSYNSSVTTVSVCLTCVISDVNRPGELEQQEYHSDQ